jgi:hypothetical protein
MREIDSMKKDMQGMTDTVQSMEDRLASLEEFVELLVADENDEVDEE